MKLLIIGGTVFLGRHLVDAAMSRGHEVTLFNRGQHNPDLYPEVEKLRGDRDGGLALLRGRQWDAALDTCGYVPRVVRASAEALAEAVRHYTFISSLSVYADASAPGIDESGAVGTLADPTVEEVTGETYGPLKALCEQAAEAAMPGRTLVIRPGLIVGPFDPTDRFTYWPHRVAQGGAVLAPGRPDRAVQFIDVRDLADWTIRMIETRATGVYNADGRGGGVTLGQVLDASRASGGSDATIEWVDEQFLLDRGVEPWGQLPLWVPDTDENRGFFAFNCSRAEAAGLTHRPLAATVGDTLAWDRTRGEDVELGAGLTRERERELLVEWRRADRQ